MPQVHLRFPEDLVAFFCASRAFSNKASGHYHIPKDFLTGISRACTFMGYWKDWITGSPEQR